MRGLTIILVLSLIARNHDVPVHNPEQVAAEAHSRLQVWIGEYDIIGSDPASVLALVGGKVTNVAGTECPYIIWLSNKHGHLLGGDVVLSTGKRGGMIGLWYFEKRNETKWYFAKWLNKVPLTIKITRQPAL